jgi:DNA-binding NtrC family response regulator
MAGLMHYGWRGNVRELQNFIERAVILSPYHPHQQDAKAGPLACKQYTGFVNRQTETGGLPCLN